jgi:signal transduction histidine kinase
VRNASYPRLRPGHYTFLFTACNNDGAWNTEPFRLTFEIIPAFWQTTWFRVGVVILFAGLVGGTVRSVTKRKMRRKLVRLEQAHTLERERTRISRDLHDDLGARLTQMELRDVSQQARSAVQSLDETVWMVNPQKDTLPHLIVYLATYAEQFFQPTAIHCRQEICQNPSAITLPGNLRRDIFFLVKEALNNVLKHSEAKEVWLRIAVRGSVMRIVIQDDGRGFSLSQTKSQRHGLENMCLRATAAGIKLRMRSEPGKGTRLTLRVVLPSPEKPKRAGFLGAFE